VLLKEYLPGAKSVACNEVQVRSCHHYTDNGSVVYTLQHVCLHAVDARKLYPDSGSCVYLQARHDAEHRHSTYAAHLCTGPAHAGCVGVESIMACRC